MADEIRITGNFNLSNGNDNYQQSYNFNADQATAGGGGPGVQLVGTTHETLSADGVTNQGMAILKNLDSTNFVEVGLEVSATFYPVLKLLPGEVAQVRLSPSSALYAKADTADVRLQAYIFEA